MLWRALLAFLALPGIVAIALPAWFAAAELRSAHAFHSVGLLPLLGGLGLLLWCVREFYVSGKGTLAPWSPPKHLVASGPYRFSRNPMYVAVCLMLIGWALAFASSRLGVYCLFVVVAFQLRVVYGEEPWLARTHGEAWADYRARVPRWLL
jgi:protein-S-isoprenylcysteine O-methyltransferase Ste14